MMNDGSNLDALLTLDREIARQEYWMTATDLVRFLGEEAEEVLAEAGW